MTLNRLFFTASVSAAPAAAEVDRSPKLDGYVESSDFFLIVEIINAEKIQRRFVFVAGSAHGSSYVMRALEL